MSMSTKDEFGGQIYPWESVRHPCMLGMFTMVFKLGLDRLVQPG